MSHYYSAALEENDDPHVCAFSFNDLQTQTQLSHEKAHKVLYIRKILNFEIYHFHFGNNIDAIVQKSFRQRFSRFSPVVVSHIEIGNDLNLHPNH